MLRNRDLAELLSREAKSHSEHRRRALERAARAALWRWTEEAADIDSQGRSLTELALVGPLWRRSSAAGEHAFIEFGLAAAIHAGIRRDRIMNILPRDQLLAWSRATRGAASRSG